MTTTGRIGRIVMVPIVMVLSSACGEEASTPSAPPAPAVVAEAETAPEAPAVEPQAEPEPEPAPAAEPVDLLRAIPTQVRASSAMSDNPAQIARLFDGDLTTAWNSKSEDLAGAFIEVRLPPQAEVQAIEMTSGYTHRRGARDLFRGNHRVRRVRVVRDDVEVGRFSLDVDDQALQRLPVRGAGGTYRIEMLEVLEGTEPTWREACISELRVVGTAAGASAGSVEPTVSIVPAAQREALARAFAAATQGEGGGDDADGEESDPVGDEDLVHDDDALDDDALDDDALDDDAMDEDAPPALATDPAAGPQIVEREGLHLTELTVAAAVESRQAVDPRSTFSRASDTRVYCLMRLDNPERAATTITLRWELVENPDRGNEHVMNVAAGPRYTTWGFTGTRGRAGRYRCVVRDDAGELLGSAAYELTD